MSADSPTKSSHARRLEWIYLVYLAFFVLAVMSPSFVTHSYFGVTQTHIEEFLIFAFGLAGLGTFSIYERLMEGRLRERDEAQGEADRAKSELIESYQYIGSVNRQIDLLKSLVNKTSISLVDTDAYWKDILQSLARNAAASVNAGSVLIRFVDLPKMRTEREVFYSADSKKQPKMSNKELLKLHEYGASHAFTRSEDGEEILVVPSDRKDPAYKAFFLLTTDPSRTSSLDVSLVKVFVNQAELVYHSLMKNGKDALPQEPMGLVEAVTSKVKGEVK
ncbi:MAG: hypothetical protein WA001_03385 [Patescibacteria group bacterium]